MVHLNTICSDYILFAYIIIGVRESDGMLYTDNKLYNINSHDSYQYCGIQHKNDIKQLILGCRLNSCSIMSIEQIDSF
jgi:hypothetical protein